MRVYSTCIESKHAYFKNLPVVMKDQLLMMKQSSTIYSPRSEFINHKLLHEISNFVALACSIVNFVLSGELVYQARPSLTLQKSEGGSIKQMLLVGMRC